MGRHYFAALSLDWQRHSARPTAGYYVRAMSSDDAKLHVYDTRNFRRGRLRRAKAA